jgi:hypothetical protein
LGENKNVDDRQRGGSEAGLPAGIFSYQELWYSVVYFMTIWNILRPLGTAISWPFCHFMVICMIFPILVNNAKNYLATLL